MSEVEFRLTNLRSVAETFRQSGQQIDQSVQAVHHLILLTLSEFPALEQSPLAVDYHAQRGLLDQWATMLVRFGDKLTTATDDLERALHTFNQEQTVARPVHPTTAIYVPPPVAVAAAPADRRLRLMRDLLLSTAPPAPSPTAQTVSLDSYLSAANRIRYDELRNRQQLLVTMETQLNDLITQRDQLVQDITALENRLLSFNPSADVDSVPRIQAMQTELARLDTEIATLQNNISDLREHIAELTHRLELVTPGPDADLQTIAALEGGETAEIIKENTKDCVNYIVNRMPIPTNLPRDAYLWDDMAAQYPEYGIQVGDQPLVGSVIVLEREHSYADDRAGHLLYVEYVQDGEVWVTDNLHPDPVRLSDITTETSGEHIKYLYFPWHTQA